MNGTGSIFSSFFDMISRFGEGYLDALISFFNSALGRPLLFMLKRIKRLLRLIFRGTVILFAPHDADEKDYADAVTRAAKKCFKVMFTHPGSFFSVFFYYIKKAFTKYDFGIKTMIPWLVPALCTAVVIIGFGQLSQKKVALKIEADGELLGYVETEEDYLNARNEAENIINFSDSGAGVLPDVRYSLSLVDINSFSDSSSLSEKLVEKSNTTDSAACAVFADGELLGVLYSETAARRVLDSILNEKLSEEDNYVVSFAEELEFKTVLYPEKDIMTEKEFSEFLLSGNKTQKEYTVKDGDTFSFVAENFGMTESELMKLNSLEEIPEEVETGSILLVEEGSVRLSFKEIKTQITAEEVDYEKIEIKSSALYSGSSRVLSSGKKGYDQVTSFVTYVDGEKVSSEEFSRLTVTESVPERVQIGTKPLDEAYSNSMGGIFLWPIVGAYGINSDYGYRWGKLHGGLDLGMGGAEGTSLGKTVIAVAQGTVIVAGVHSSYGYYVIIDHGNGLQTLYAHCLAGSLMVEPGQIVAAGQPISRVGSTGYSTGPHLHFEVRVNGNRVNPRPYLGI